MNLRLSWTGIRKGKANLCWFHDIHFKYSKWRSRSLPEFIQIRGFPPCFEYHKKYHEFFSLRKPQLDAVKADRQSEVRSRQVQEALELFQLQLSPSSTHYENLKSQLSRIQVIQVESKSSTGQLSQKASLRSEQSVVNEGPVTKENDGKCLLFLLLKRNSKLHKSLESLQSWLESIARSPRANTQAPIMVTPIDIIAFKLARGNNPKGWQSSVLDGKLQAKSRCTLLTSLGPTSWRVPETWFAAIE